MNLQQLLYNQRARNAVFLDTNIFVLLVVGSLDPRLLAGCKKTRQFSESDFEILVLFLGHFQSVRTTAPIITETCNLLDSFNANRNQTVFASLAVILKRLRERHIQSVKLSDDPAFLTLGLADVSLLSAAKNGSTVVTDDLDFYLHMESLNLAALNFNHLRASTWANS